MYSVLLVKIDMVSINTPYIYTWVLCTLQNSLHAFSLFYMHWINKVLSFAHSSLIHIKTTMLSSNKISQHNLNSNIPHRPSIAQAVHSFCMQSRQTISAMLSLATTLQQPTTTHPTTKKHKAYWCKWWQSGTRWRDGVKVLGCHSHLSAVKAGSVLFGRICTSGAHLYARLCIYLII